MSRGSIEKLQRVLWRVRTNYPKDDKVPLKGLEMAIMMEIGQDKRTISKYIKVLKKIGWLRGWSRHKVKLTNKDLEES